MFRKKVSLEKFPKLYRTKEIEGVSIPGIIHNSQYFFVDLDVYEDGRINCWNFQDFEHFKSDVQNGWVSVKIPNGKSISIHGLGDWKIDKGKWEYNNNSFIEYVYSIIKKLNPKLENLFKYSEKKNNGITIGESGNGKSYKEQKTFPKDPFPKKITSKSLDLYFKVRKNEYFLARLDIFSKDSIIINRVPKPIEINMKKLEEMVADNLLVSELPVNSIVKILQFGKFMVIEELYSATINEKMLEIKDLLSRLNGELSSLEICRNIYSEYQNNPSDDLKEKLKVSYEKIPAHKRVYVGDMDTKDIPIRMIIYGEKEIENWSHYQVAKERGEELPSIKIPNQSNGENS